MKTSGKEVIKGMTLEEAIFHAEEVAIEKFENAQTIRRNPWGDKSKIQGCLDCAAEHRQLAAWLSILKKAKSEYDEAWRILTHPTPDVRYPDIDRAKMILDVFRDSLGVLNE